MNDSDYQKLHILIGKNFVRSGHMKNRTRIILRYLFVVLLGVFLHFAYELSGKNPIVGLFASVNESIWEHLKLLFFPFLILTLWDLFTTQKNSLCILPARTLGILAGLLFIVVVFYTVTGILGFHASWLNIFIYLLSVAFAFWVEKKLYEHCNPLSVKLAIAILILFIILFIVFTISPPTLGIFIPPDA